MTFVPRYLIGSLDLTAAPFLVLQDEDRGAPQNVADVVDSLLQDGTLISSKRSDNRAMAYTVYIDEADLEACAAAEQRLIAECDKERNTFTVEPGDGVGAATVFDTFRVQARFVYDAAAEQMNLRRYDLEIPALPFGRSDTEVTSVGVVSTGTTTTVINDCSSATSWSAQYASATPFTPTVSGGAIVIDADVPTGGSVPGVLTYAPASPVSMSTTPYFYLDWKMVDVTADKLPTVRADGAELTRLTSVAQPNGYTRTTFMCPDASVAAFKIKAPVAKPKGTSAFGDFMVDQIVKTNVAPVLGTSRQKIMDLPVLGSARAVGTLKIEHETSALGDVLLYSYEDDGSGYTPDLRRWLTSTAGTTDATTVSGATNALGSNVYAVPLNILRPGAHLLLARAKVSLAGTVTINGKSVVFADTNYKIITLGVENVADHVPGSAFSHTITITGSGGTITLDEAWLFYMGDGAHLSQFSLGTSSPTASGSSNRLFLKNATPDHPWPSAWRGTLADESDARVVTDFTWAQHELTPGGVKVFAVTTNALDATTSASYYPAWHTHARRLP